jgi:mannosylglycerate synthase
VPSDLPHTTETRSLVVVPFLDEDSELVLRTLAIAAAHPRVAEVVGVSGSHLRTNQQVEGGAPSIKGAPVRIIPQERIGNRRPGKGDAVNTGFRHFLENTSLDRIHFYDADIKTFYETWIEKAEVAADRGFEAVRHYYPRAATDAMITWMVTRPGLALLWPQSELPWIAQPLSGELMFARSAAEVLANDQIVRNQSDWGIDTMITAATIHHGLSIYECYISEGKDHALYGPLTDIRVMMVECLAALQTLNTSVQPQRVIHRIEYPHAVATAITEKLAYDIEATQQLLAEGWTPRQEQMLEAYFPPRVVTGARKWKRWPDTSFLDEETWLSILGTLIDQFVLSDDDWVSIAFRLWLGRVLQYTLTVAVRGHSYSLAYLNHMVLRAAHAR